MTGRPPLGWQANDDGPDVGAHLNAVRTVAGTLMAIDGLKDLDSLPEGAVCTLMVMLDHELTAAESILEDYERR